MVIGTVAHMQRSNKRQLSRRSATSTSSAPPLFIPKAPICVIRADDASAIEAVEGRWCSFLHCYQLPWL
jgi:hypothetical protein